jgi:hypothetical protein
MEAVTSSARINSIKKPYGLNHACIVEIILKRKVDLMLEASTQLTREVKHPFLQKISNIKNSHDNQSTQIE